MRRTRSERQGTWRKVFWIILGLALGTGCTDFYLTRKESIAKNEVKRVISYGNPGFLHVYVSRSGGLDNEDGGFELCEDRNRVYFECSGDSIFTLLWDKGRLYRGYSRTDEKQAVVIESRPKVTVIPIYQHASPLETLDRCSFGKVTQPVLEKRVSRDNLDTLADPCPPVVDRMTAIVNDGYESNAVTLLANSTSLQPLLMYTKMMGVSRNDYSEFQFTWRLQKPDPSYFGKEFTRLNKDVPVFDLDREREFLKSAMAKPSKIAAVMGKKVELCQVWLGYNGVSYAIISSDDMLSGSASFRINGKGSPLKGSPSAVMGLSYPTMFQGRPFQIFRTVLNKTERKSFVGLSTANVQIPVFQGSKIVGTATFDKVPIDRTFDVKELIEPRGIPFWTEGGLKFPTTFVYAAEAPSLSQ